jgi:hypothetical protein
MPPVPFIARAAQRLRRPSADAPPARESERRRLRLLVVTQPPPPKRLPKLFTELLEADVDLVFSLPATSLPAALRSHPNVSAVDLPLARSGPDADAVKALRATADAMRFLRPDLASAHFPRSRALARLARLGGTEGTGQQLAGLGLTTDACQAFGAALRDVERRVPPERALKTAVSALDVDAILLVSRCVMGGFDPDVVKVAREIGLPSLMLVWSWDNLSGKAVLIEPPDHLIVWNEIQVREAVEQHLVPPERVIALGAPNFDVFFDELSNRGPSPPRADGERSILYLASSHKIAPQEPKIADRWIAAVRTSEEALVRDAKIVIRPHPAVTSWMSWQPPDDRVEITGPGAKSETEAAAATLADLLAAADAVVALNTSAELEASIADCPVLTFRAPDARGQEASAHFEYLLESHGGFVLDAPNLEEHVRRLGAVFRGEYDRERIRAFVASFIRPAGVSQPVVPLIASTILKLAAAGVPARPGA